MGLRWRQSDAKNGTVSHLDTFRQCFPFDSDPRRENRRDFPMHSTFSEKPKIHNQSINQSINQSEIHNGYVPGMTSGASPWTRSIVKSIQVGTRPAENRLDAAPCSNQVASVSSARSVRKNNDTAVNSQPMWCERLKGLIFGVVPCTEWESSRAPSGNNVTVQKETTCVERINRTVASGENCRSAPSLVRPRARRTQSRLGMGHLIIKEAAAAHIFPSSSSCLSFFLLLRVFPPSCCALENYRNFFFFERDNVSHTRAPDSQGRARLHDTVLFDIIICPSAPGFSCISIVPAAAAAVA